MQNPFITKTEGDAVLMLAITCFEYGVLLRPPIRRFVCRNYTLDDFQANGVNIELFVKWLNS